MLTDYNYIRIMNKNATYVGIFCRDPKNSAKQLRNYSKQCIKLITEEVEDCQLIYSDLQAFDDVFCYPKDNHHITAAFLGKNPTGKVARLFKNFKHEEIIPIEIDLFVYVPRIIMVGYCSNTGKIDVVNAHPHVTLLLGHQTKPVESNDVLQIVFQESHDILKQEFKVKKLESKYKNAPIYVVNMKIAVQGITGDNVRRGNR